MKKQMHVAAVGETKDFFKPEYAATKMSKFTNVVQDCLCRYTY